MLNYLCFALLIYILFHIIYKCVLNYKHQCSSMAPSDNVSVYWFSRPGCPHCDNMEPAWNMLKNSELPSNYKLNTINITMDKNKKLADDFGVSGVPHIVKQFPNGKRVVYNGDRSYSHMKEWVLN